MQVKYDKLLLHERNKAAEEGRRREAAEEAAVTEMRRRKAAEAALEDERTKWQKEETCMNALIGTLAAQLEVKESKEREEVSISPCRLFYHNGRSTWTDATCRMTNSMCRSLYVELPNGKEVKIPRGETKPITIGRQALKAAEKVTCPHSFH